MSKENVKRNKELARLRDSKPEAWTFGELAKFFRIKRETAHEIYHREKSRKR